MLHVKVQLVSLWHPQLLDHFSLAWHERGSNSSQGSNPTVRLQIDTSLDKAAGESDRAPRCATRVPRAATSIME